MSDTPRVDAAEREGNKQLTLLGNLRVVLERFREMELSRQPSEEAVDAKRYRWLRECKGDVCAGIEDYPNVQWLDTTDLDAAVDKAMLAAAGKEKP